MSLDRSLRLKSSLERHRNVLSRAERVAALIAQERFSDDMSPIGLPKVSHRKASAGKKKTPKDAAAAGTEEAPKPA